MSTNTNDFDRLVSGWCDGALTDAEFATLEQFLQADAACRDRFLQLTAIHGGLSWEFAEQPARQRELAPLSPSSHSVASEPSHQLRWSALWWAATALLLLLAVWLGWNVSGDSSSTDLPLIVRTSAGVMVKNAAQVTQPALVGQTVSVGETVQLEAGDELALRYADGTQFKLSGAAVLQVAKASPGGKRLNLREGTLLAQIAPQPADHPLLIDTPQATVRVLGTRFELSTDQHQSQLNLEQGRVELVREQEPVVCVEENQVAYLSAAAPIAVHPRPQVVSQPEREWEFSRLKSIGFAADDHTLVGCTEWQAVYFDPRGKVEAWPLAADRRELLLGQPRNDRASYRAGQLLVFETKAPRQLVVWDSQLRRQLRTWDHFEVLLSETEHNLAAVPSKKPFITAIATDGTWMTTRVKPGRVHQFQLHDLVTGDVQLIEQPTTEGWLSSFCASPDGKWLAVSLSNIGRDRLNAVLLYAVAEKAWLPSLPIQRSHLTLAMSFSADSRLLALGMQGEVQVWDTHTQQLTARLTDPGHHLNLVAITPDGSQVIAAGQSALIRVWSLHNPTQPTLLETQGRVLDLQVSANGQQLAAVVQRDRVLVWRLDQLNTLAPPTPQVPID